MTGVTPTPYWRRRTVATAVEPELYDKFKAIADRHNVTVAAYMRATIVDVVEEEYETNAPSIQGMLPTPQ